MSEEDGVETVYAIVTRRSETNEYELVCFEFLKGLAGFVQWSDHLPKAIRRVESGGRITNDLGTPQYVPDSEANVVAVVMTGRSTYQYSWRTDEMGWSFMKTLVADQDRTTDGMPGRPRKLVQPLQTWKKWAKKVDARF